MDYLEKGANLLRKTSNKKVYVVGGSVDYANWLPNSELCNTLDEADVVLFTGGADVSPELYGEPRHRTTCPSPRRDEMEVPIFKEAIKKKKSIIGICRGAQLSCVMAGGKLIQHQDNNQMIHPMFMHSTGNNVLITSLHHQAMYPWNLRGDKFMVLGSTDGHSTYHYNGKGEKLDVPQDLEVVYFPEIKALGIQGHPEMLWDERQNYLETFKELNFLVESYVYNSQF